MPAQAIPEGYSGLMPSLAVDDAAAAIEFYTRALGARERMRMPGPSGKIGHCELARVFERAGVAGRARGRSRS